MAAKKSAWVITEAKGGWRLKLAYGSRDYKLKGLLIKKTEDVQALLDNPNAVFVHLKNSKYPKAA